MRDPGLFQGSPGWDSKCERPQGWGSLSFMLRAVGMDLFWLLY